jgi:ribosome-associated protein
MARKPRYRERPETAAPEELEQEEGRGRSARKRASHELTKLGEELVALRVEQVAALTLPERLEDAVAEARRLTSFGAKRRQTQFIGKLMRTLDEEQIAAIRKALQRTQSSHSR